MFVRWISRTNKKGLYDFAYLCQTTRELGKVQNHTICPLGKIPQQPDKLDRELFWRDATQALEQQTLSLPERSKIEASIAQKVPRGKNPHGDSNACVEWYTPKRYIEMARDVLGNIDLDPASNDVAQQWIKASQYFNAAEDGLKQSWHGRIWCNPPYGRQVHKWLEKGLDSYQQKTIDCAIFLLNRTGAAWYKTLIKRVTAICEVKKRISFVDASGTPQPSPRYYNDFIYLGRDPERFDRVYSAIGDVVNKHSHKG